MKKLFTILTLVAFTTTASFAQFSLKAGLNMANIVTNNDDAENGMKLGMIVGGSYAMELSDAMSLDMSATFKQSGTKESYEQSEPGLKVESTGTYSINYLDISPSLSFNVSDQFALSVGPYLAFAMSGKITNEVVTSGTTAEAAGTAGTVSTSEAIEFGEANLEENSPDGISSMDFGINIGTTYSINDEISVSAGYALGLSDLYSISDEVRALMTLLDPDTKIPTIKNTGIFITLGYSFGGY